ncbi:MAG: LacI family DNA-binding transcriptional regulator [Opitutales bacterium]
MRELPHRVTLKAIAAEAGVSQATVSLSLQGNPRISASTRRRICALAKRMGYLPDPGVSRMNLYRWGERHVSEGSSVAYLTAFGHVSRPNTGFRSFQQTCWNGACEEAMKLGYSLFHLDLNQYARPQSVNRLLKARGVRGLIVGPVRDAVWAKGLDWESFPAVAIERGAIQLPIHTISPDDFAGARLICQQLRGRGYRRIGLTVQWDNLTYGYPETRVAGLLHEMQFGERTLGQMPLLQTDFRDVGKLKQWLEQYRPDCVVGTNGSVYWDLHDAGWRCPRDVGCAILVYQRLRPDAVDVSGIDRRGFQLGVAAMQFLDSRIRLNQTLPAPEELQTILVPPKWEEGTTVQPVRRRSTRAKTRARLRAPGRP